MKDSLTSCPTCRGPVVRSGVCRTLRVQFNHQLSSPAHCAASTVLAVRFHRFRQIKELTDKLLIYCRNNERSLNVFEQKVVV